MKEINYCPFCGSEAKLNVTDDGVRVICTNNKCGCQTPFLTDKHQSVKDSAAIGFALKIWNRRILVNQYDVKND